MLTHNLSERKDNEVILEDIDAETVKIIVDFWYTNEMAMTSTNISSLLLAASRFQAKTALEMCKKFAGANLAATNCLIIAVLCERCNFGKLGKRAFIHCLASFESIIQEEEFLSLHEEFFTKILSHNRLNAGHEINVFEAIIKWIQFDGVRRSGLLIQLMHEVCFASVDASDFLGPSIRDLAQISDDYRDVVVKAMATLLSKGQPELFQGYVA